MSYEGRVQIWCENGHYGEADIHQHEVGGPCMCCGGPIVVHNPVDDTNGEAHGFIEPVVITPAVLCTCAECGNKHEKQPAVYKIPNLEELKAAHPVYPGEGCEPTGFC